MVSFVSPSKLAKRNPGTDSSQGKGQVISNINACLAVQDTIRSTLGPYGGDLLLVDERGKQTITNDGATIMKVCYNYSDRTWGDFSWLTSV